MSRSVVQRTSKQEAFKYQEFEFALHPEVYEPSDDSFLLLEALRLRPHDSVLELGTGCGLIAVYCASQGCAVICSDINPFAVRLTRQNMQRNQHLLNDSLVVRQGNLFSVVHTNDRFSLIVFNPPYLPTSDKERVGRWFDVATDGGRDGLRVTTRFIHGLRQHLQDAGRAYFLFSSLSNRSSLEKLLKNEGFSSEVVASKHFHDESLHVCCVTPTD